MTDFCLEGKCDSGSQLVGQEVNSKFWVTWLSFAQFVYFLREVCLLFNFWMIKFTIMFFFDIHAWNFSTKVLYMSKKHTSLKNDLVLLSLYIFWEKYVFLTCSCEISFVNVKKKHNCEFYHSKIENQTHFPQKIYKLSKTN